MEIDGMPVVLGGFSGFINLDWLNLKNISDFFAGMGDEISSGFGLTYILGVPSLTEQFRKRRGYNDIVDKSSEAYKTGALAGELTSWYLAGTFFFRPFTHSLQTITHWNTQANISAGIIGPWAMVGGRSWRNYFFSGIIGKYRYKDAITITVSGSTLKYPSGWLGFLKGLWGQRIYQP
jgi:hypothetical protein